jgi:endonuclease YncB( thermonuclease family)
MENRKYVMFLAPIILGLLIFGSNLAFGYEVGTHEFISDTAINLFNKSSAITIDSNLRKYVLDGTRREDDPPRWMNHFYDPVYNRGLTQDNRIEPTYQLGNWQASNLWVQDGSNQNKLKYSPVIATILSSIQSGKIEQFFPTADFTWHEALKYWIQGDKEMAMFTLGHIIHLVQDVSVPDHTRNDPHAGDSPYENYSAQYTLSNPDTTLIQKTNNAGAINLPDLNSYFTELATYSNNNFYSKDTIGIQSGYDSPQPDYPKNEGDYDYEYKEDPDGNTYKLAIAGKQSLFNSVVSNKETYVIATNKTGGDVVLNDYWKLLSPKAVEYSAGVINLFFQEVEKNKNNPEFAKKEGKSLVAQVMGAITDGFGNIKNFFNGVFGGNQFQQVSEIPTDSQSTDANTPDENIDEPIAPSQSLPIASNSDNQDLYKVTRVIDGDTIVLENGMIIRYLGIDAPELAYQEGKSDCFAVEARERNLKLVLNKKVKIEYSGIKTDKYDRTLAYVWVGNVLVNKVMVAEGYAYAYNFNNPQPHDVEFQQDQVKARDSRLGLWGQSCHKEDTATTTEDVTSTTTLKLSGSESFCSYETAKYPSHQNVIINETAWMGTTNSANDEWIELKNISSLPVDLSGYQLIGKGNDIEINLGKAKNVILSSDNFFLLERTDDNSVPNVTADLIYSGTLSNSDEGLRLFDSGCNLIDEVIASPSWPAGDSSSKRTMERDTSGYGWHTSSAIGGTPKAQNSSAYLGGAGGGNTQVLDSGTQSSAPQKPAPQFYPLIINEIMYNPDGTDSGREWIEIYNSGSLAVDIADWKLSENETNHSLALKMGSSVIASGQYAVVADNSEKFLIDYPNFSGSLFDSAFSLNNNGETIAIKNGDLKIDELTYLPTQGADGNGTSLQKFSTDWKEAPATPGVENLLPGKNERWSSAPRHLIISEIQVSGSNGKSDDEFIEIYNPTQTPISLENYSLQYLSGHASSTENIYKKNISENLIVPPLKFLLFANKNGKFSGQSDFQYSFSLSGESAGGIIILSGTTDPVQTLNDPNIIDFVAYGNVSMPVASSAQIPEENQSIERMGVENMACTTSQNQGEFIGNACDTTDDSFDFEIRTNPRPQGLANLAEPRIAPNPVGNLSLSYSSSSLQISAMWDKPAGNGENEPFSYEIKDAISDEILANTASTTTVFRTDEIGKDAILSIDVIDPDGMRSGSVTSTISIPSLLSSLNLFSDPTDDTKYILDGTYETYPFVPSLYAERSPWSGSALVFFLNRDAAKEPYIEGGYKSNSSEVMDSLLVTDYKHCHGYSGTRNIFMVADFPCWLGGMVADAPPKENFEDDRFSIKALPQKTLTGNDYITVAFYAFDHSNSWSGGTEILRLAAVDKTKYYFSTDMPARSAPSKVQNFVTEFHDELNNPHAFLKWDDSTDTDSLDSLISYEYAISTGTPDINTLSWTPTRKGFRADGGVLTQISPEIPLTSSGNYTFYLRAKDELGLTSDYATSTLEYFPPEFITGINSLECDFSYTPFGVATLDGSANSYKIGQKFKLNNPSTLKELVLEIHNADFPAWFKNQYGASASNFDAKVSINYMSDSSDPNSGLSEIYSKVITGLPALQYYEKNYISIKLESPIALDSGDYFIAIETVGGNLTNTNQGLGVSLSTLDKYPDGSAYTIPSPTNDPTHTWRQSIINLFFRILGSTQSAPQTMLLKSLKAPTLPMDEPADESKKGGDEPSDLLQNVGEDAINQIELESNENNSTSSISVSEQESLSASSTENSANSTENNNDVTEIENAEASSSTDSRDKNASSTINLNGSATSSPNEISEGSELNITDEGTDNDEQIIPESSATSTTETLDADRVSETDTNKIGNLISAEETTSEDILEQSETETANTPN